MAEQGINDVVKEAQSMGRPAPIGDTASTTSLPAVNGATTNPKPLQVLPHANGTDAALNGDTDHHSATESQTGADASGGSDTDISRPSSVDQSRQEAGHVRANSAVKKTSTFKSVSVTKNFLAKSAVSTPATRLGEKTAPAVQPSNSSVLTAKPRLVAKSGAGNTPRALGKANGVGVGPDASKVWNKNQPIPPPPPKQFTDEELKQQYGIHLATRLQADEAGKEAKWADIDDDEDDWAPEAVQWMDGTKSSVTAVESQPPPTEEPKTILKPETHVDVPKFTPTADAPTSKPSLTGGAKTILKPGIHTQTAPTRSSLVLKGQPEKPTLVAKPSATEKKSPWATLPPVEKIPPVQINPPVQQPPPRFSQRESYSYESMPPPPAKEIAPDDFNRSWRDDRGSRELFNSQSGRYEPVNEMRRGSMRDSSFRQQPSVLQRPAQDGPAEPSAAFQTSRSSTDMPTWGRRRNSSNVSGEQIRRMSIDRRAPETPRGPVNIERRDSQSVNGLESSDTGTSRQSPHNQAASPNIVHAHPVSPYGSMPPSSIHDSVSAAPPAENPVEVQKRLMADKIERARLKKQQEQEAEKKAEAERKERIAKRLAAMGPLPEAKSKTKEPSPSRTSDHSSQKAKSGSIPTQSPPKPPVPTADGEVAQYGMMKVHQAQPVKKPSQTEPPTATKSALSTSGTSLSKPRTDSQTKTLSPQTQHAVQPFDSFGRDNEKHRQSSEQAKNNNNQSEGTISSGQKQQAPPVAWSSTTTPQPRPWTSQVWGPLQTKERALGNGTFDSGYNRGQPRSAQQQLPVQKTSPTPPNGLNIAPQPQTPSQPTSQLPPSQPTYPQAGTLPVQAAAPTKPGRIVPPLTNGWGNFEAHIRQDDAGMAAKARQDRERLGDGFRPEIRETYKDQRGQAQTTLHDKVSGNLTVHDGSIKKDDVANVAKSVLEMASPQQNLSHGTSLQQISGPRASRFFPRATEAPTSSTAATSNKADSPPPPPETEAHPAFTGDISQPLVRLPKPSPVVRLPPLAPGSSTFVDPPVNMPTRGQPLGARPLAMNPEWQARFNKLLEKPASTPATGSALRGTPPPTISVAASKPGALAPAALSKSSLDVRGNADSATVSLPSGLPSRVFSNDGGRDVITRYGTEALFEDREFGSLPTVKLSKVSHLAANEPPVKPPTDDPHIRFKRFENPFTIRRLEAFDVEKLAQKIDVIIYIPNMRDAILKSMPRRRRSPKSNTTPKPKQSNSQIAAPASGSKDRSRKPPQQSQSERPSNSPRPPVPNAWGNNNRSTPPHQQSTWARRAAASVH